MEEFKRSEDIQKILDNLDKIYEKLKELKPHEL